MDTVKLVIEIPKRELFELIGGKGVLKADVKIDGSDVRKERSSKKEPQKTNGARIAIGDKIYRPYNVGYEEGKNIAYDPIPCEIDFKRTEKGHLFFRARYGRPMGIEMTGGSSGEPWVAVPHNEFGVVCFCREEIPPEGWDYFKVDFVTENGGTAIVLPVVSGQEEYEEIMDMFTNADHEQLKSICDACDKK